jgi:VWFA-related protein
LLNIFALAVIVGLLVGQQPQTPVFRGSTDVVVVDVRVADRAGSHVTDLTASDFTLEIDGRPRAITSASFQRVQDLAKSTRRSAPLTTLGSGAPPVAASYVMFVADPALMRPEASRVLFDQAATFMSTLPPEHVVGLIVVPARRPQYPFSLVRQPMARALQRQLGILTGDAYFRSQSMASIAALELAIDELRQADGRRTLVYLCDQLPEFSYENAIDLARAANAAGITIDVIASDPLVFPGASQRGAPEPPPPGGDFGALPTLSDLTGGTFYRRVVTGAMVFDRLARELSAQYVLTFDVRPDDRTGTTHAIKVRTTRPNVELRFRQQFVR